MITSCKPELQDLWFKQVLLSDPETMAYNRAWGGTIPFPEERWSAWYDRWIRCPESERFYRYLRDEDGAFVGEIAYHLDTEDNRYLADVLIHAKYRGRGYGSQGLIMLCKTAKENGIPVLYDEIAIDNPAIRLFLRSGFTEESRTEEAILIRKDLSD